MSTRTLGIGIAGLGTVGASAVGILINKAESLATKSGATLEIRGICARNRGADRGIDLSAVPWFDDPVVLARDGSVDIFVELIGGADGVAKAAVEAALSAGKCVVTANKALLAAHGNALAALAENTSGASLHYEAAVAGGIPAIKALREGMAGNRVHRVSGILNGTCNYILTEMETGGAAFDDVLAEAQRLGYAEADPTADVGGFDAAQKLAILAAIAFGQPVNYSAVEIEGIENVSAADIANAGDLGYRVRLLGVAERHTDGISQRVRPCLVPRSAPLALISGVTNAVMIEGDAIGAAVLTGPGAGGGPTASAVLADIVDAARGNHPPTFGVPVSGLVPGNTIPAGEDSGPFFLRLTLQDRPGALAEVARVLGEEGVSIQRMRQHDHVGEAAPVTIVTHATRLDALMRAKAAITELEVSVGSPASMRIADG